MADYTCPSVPASFYHFVMLSLTPRTPRTPRTPLSYTCFLPGGAASAAATKKNEEKKEEKKAPADRRGNMAGGGKKNVITISLSKNHYLAGDVATGTVNLEAKAVSMSPTLEHGQRRRPVVHALVPGMVWYTERTTRKVSTARKQCVCS